MRVSQVVHRKRRHLLLAQGVHDRHLSTRTGKRGKKSEREKKEERERKERKGEYRGRWTRLRSQIPAG